MHPETATHPHGTSPVRGMAASVIFIVMLIAALALWTAIPVGWIYIAWLIGRLNALYMRITGTNRLAPMRPSWLKSMRDTGTAAGTTTVVEAVMIGSVMVAGLVFVGWFFLLAGSPIPNQ
jgi:hypothetical protein